MNSRADSRNYLTIEAREHGGVVPAELTELGIRPEDVADFSVNTNPYGPAPVVLDAVRSARVDVYPDPRAWHARLAVAGATGTSAAHVCLGNGAAELLWTLARALLRPGDPVLIVAPTFSEFVSAARAQRALIHEWTASEADAFCVSLPDVAARLEETRAKALYVCSPNTPTGTAVDVRKLGEMAAEFPDMRIVLDQSFLSLSERASEAALPVPPNVIRVRSLTKDQAVPGVRVGYLLAAPSLVAALDCERSAWSSSAAAQAVARCVPQTVEFIAKSCARWLVAKSALASGFAERGYSVWPSCTGFFLVRVGNGRAFRRRLLSEHALMVRDCASFGLPEFVRVGARADHDNQRLLTALTKEIQTP